MPDVATSLKVDRATKTLRELARDKLRDAILVQRFKPGDRLREREHVHVAGEIAVALLKRAGA